MSKSERLFGLLALLSLLAINVGYVHYVNHRSAQRAEVNRIRTETSLCEIFGAELALYRENPPDNPTRQARFEVYSGLWNSHCTDEKEGS